LKTFKSALKFESILQHNYGEPKTPSKEDVERHEEIMKRKQEECEKKKK